MNATGGMSRSASSIAFGSRSGWDAHGGELVRMQQKHQHRVEHHRLHGLDGAEENHAELGDDLVVRELQLGVVGDCRL